MNFVKKIDVMKKEETSPQNSNSITSKKRPKTVSLFAFGWALVINLLSYF